MEIALRPYQWLFILLNCIGVCFFAGLSGFGIIKIPVIAQLGFPYFLWSTANLMRYFHLKNEGYKNLKKYHNLHFVSNIKEGDVKLVKLLYFKRFFFQGVNLYFEVRENELIINYACVYTKHHITKELLEQIRKITFEEAQKNQKLRIPLLFDDYKIEVKKISA